MIMMKKCWSRFFVKINDNLRCKTVFLEIMRSIVRCTASFLIVQITQDCVVYVRISKKLRIPLVVHW